MELMFPALALYQRKLGSNEGLEKLIIKSQSSRGRKYPKLILLLVAPGSMNTSVEKLLVSL